METIFGAAFILMIASGVLAYGVNSDILKRPPNNIPLMLLCSVANFAAVPFIIFGFVRFPWIIPVATLALSFIGVPILYNMFLRSPRAALFAILMALIGLGLGVYCVFYAAKA